MHSYLLFCSFFIGVCLGGTTYSSTCRDKTPMENVNEDMCILTNPWYLFASSEQCDGCCESRSLVKIKPGVVETIEKVMKANSTAPTVRKFIIVRSDPKVIYNRSTGQQEFIMLDTDCRTYAVPYFPTLNKLSVYTAQPNQTSTFLESLNRVAKCNMKMYKYSPSPKCA